MIFFDRFLGCISLKSFGKFIGWVGMMIYIFTAYAIFLVVSAKSAGVEALRRKYFGTEMETSGIHT